MTISFAEGATEAILTGYMSDNAAGAAPQIVEAVAAAATGLVMPYGDDPLTQVMQTDFAQVFERDVDVFPVSSGTAANGLALSALTPPWGGVVVHCGAHTNNDEAGGPEFFTGSAKLLAVDGADSKVDPDLLRARIALRKDDLHGVPPKVLSLTQITETGSVYSLDELKELSDIAHEAGMRVHMDGARFANALVELNASPAEMSWKLGVDVLSFGATKNGTMTVDAVISFDPDLKMELSYRHKRSGQLSSKMRFQTAQLSAYLKDDFWLQNARQANTMAERLREGLRKIPGAEILGSAPANLFFCRLPQNILNGLLDQGFGFYHGRWEPGVIRLVTSFAHTERDVDAFLEAAQNIA